MGAQAGELLLVAKVGGIHLLVEIGGEGGVSRSLVAQRPLGRPADVGRQGIAVAHAFRGVLQGLVAHPPFAVLAVVHGLFPIGLHGIRVLAFQALGVGVFILFALTLGVGLEVVFGIDVGKRQVGDELVERQGEFLLVADILLERVEILAGPVDHPVAPHIDEGLDVFRRFLAGQLLAHDEADHFGHGDVFEFVDPVVVERLAAVGEGGVEVFRDTLHAQRADRLEAGLFDLVEDLARGFAGRFFRGVQLVVVVAQFQRHGIGMAANFGDLMIGQAPGRRLKACGVTADARRIGREFHLQFAVAGDRAHGGGGDASEFFDRVVFSHD